MQHPLKLLDKMYKYEMDPTRTVGATEQTQDAERTDGQATWNQYTPTLPNNFVAMKILKKWVFVFGHMTLYGYRKNDQKRAVV